MSGKNILYSQSGGVTAVINATACGVIQAARANQNNINNVYAAHNGILGILQEEFYDTSYESDGDIAALKHTPGGAFGSCRYKLKTPDDNLEQYKRLFDIFDAHDIGYFFYNGGGDSQDTTLKIAEYSDRIGFPLTCIGLPKTVDNDLALTDNSPGFGSVAKYIATSIREAGLDVQSMAATSTKVFLMEVMGRHAGWIAAAGGLAVEKTGDAPHIILFPEIPFEQSIFLKHVENTVSQHGYCAIVVSEGVRDSHGRFLSDAGYVDAFGHTQLGGVAPVLAHLIKKELNLKYHWAVADYLQRAARHIAAQVDVEQAYQLGFHAVEKALQGEHKVMLTIDRLSSTPYQWQIGSAPLDKVANYEKKIPRTFISENGFEITDACRQYLLPLIQGEDHPPYKNGLPHYVSLQKQFVKKKLAQHTIPS